jgi:tetratricopeptide (TPR) repeat protein
MLLKRSLFFYLIIAIILLRLNLNVIHHYRLGYLRHVYLVPGKGKDIPAAIVYYDYLSRVDPTDISAWSDLINSYLANNDPQNAHKAALRALKITPKDSVNYPLLLSVYHMLLNQHPLQ